MYNLLKAVPDTMSVILGDIDQLPAVGAGNALGNIIDSGVVPVVRLIPIFRQGLGSKIIRKPHKINEMLYLAEASGNLCFFTSSRLTFN